MTMDFSPYVPALFGFLGTVIGAGVSYFAQKSMAMDARKVEARNLKLGMAAEVEAYLGIVDRRAHASNAASVIDTLRLGNDVLLRNFGMEKDEDPAGLFVIFSANTAKLGILGKDATSVLEFYLAAMAVRTTARSAQRGEFDAYTINQKVRLITEELDLWQETAAKGKRLVDRLRHP